MTGSQVKGNPTEKLLRAFTTDIDKTVASADFNKQFAKLYNKTALTVTCVPLSPPPYRGLLPHCHVRVPVPSTLLWTSPGVGMAMAVAWTCHPVHGDGSRRAARARISDSGLAESISLA